MGCTSSFYDYLSNCQGSVKINASLEPETNYLWVISDKFNRQYSGAIVTDANGNFEIPTTELPAGLLNSYAGEFELSVKEVYSCGEVNLNMRAAYKSIIFRINSGSFVKDNLGCSYDCIPSSGANGNSAIFLLAENDTTFHLDWTTLLASLYGNNPVIQVYLRTAVDSDQYELTTVSIVKNQTAYGLASIDIDLGGPVFGGYVLIS